MPNSFEIHAQMQRSWLRQAEFITILKFAH